MKYFFKTFSILLVFYFCFSASVFAEDQHRWSEWITDAEPTCTEAGHAYRMCDLYPEYIHYEEKSIPPLGHLLETTVISPTCTEKGKKITKCKRCDYIVTEEFGSIIPHDYEEKIIEPTCETDGSKTYTCKYCGDAKSEIIPKTGHSYGEWITDVEPTAEAEGHQYRVCANDSTHIEKKMSRS